MFKRLSFSGRTSLPSLTTPGNDALIGVTLDDRFKITEPIGRGAMGQVYRAIQKPLNRPVALKVLDLNYGPGRDEVFRRRFLLEAALTAKLRHPNTVTVIDYGCTKDGICYLVMEYLKGQTFEALLSSYGALPWRRVVAIGQQIARSLREAHNLGVVHRDLKPGNVMMLDADADSDTVKVLDFGLVKPFADGATVEGRAITEQGMLMGSPQYMAPEQGEYNQADPRSDIYSLGIVLYEALTGAPPFTGKNPLEVILKHVKDPLPPIRIPPHLEAPPTNLELIVHKCLAKSPMDRFQSMDEVVAALTELGAPTGPTPTAAWLKSSPLENFKRLAPVSIPLGTLLLGIALGRSILAQPAPLPEMQPRAAPIAVAPAIERAVVEIDSIPTGASVTQNGTLLGVTPLSVNLAPDTRNAVFTLSSVGYIAATVSAQGGTAPSQLVVHLTPAPPPAMVKPAAPARTAKPAPVRRHAPSRLKDDDDLRPATKARDELKRPTN